VKSADFVARADAASRAAREHQPMAADRPDLPSHELLCGIPDRTDARLSPDGQQVAFLAPLGGALNLWVAPVDDLATARPLTQVTGTGLRPTHGWTYDGKYVLYALDEGGNELFHVYAVDVVSGQARDLTPYPGIHAQVVGGSPSRPDALIIAMNRDDPRRHDYYRTSIETGAIEPVLVGREYVKAFADEALDVHAGVRSTDDGGAVVEIIVRGEVRPVLTIAPEDSIAFVVGQQPGLNLDSTALYLLTSTGAPTVRLVRVDVATGALTDVAGDPERDVEAVFIDAATREPLAVCVAGARKQWRAVQPELQTELDTFTAGRPGDALELSNSLDGDRWLATFGDPSGPSTWELWNRTGRSRTVLFADRPALADHRLGSTEPFEFLSRDGLTVRGYVTLPPGRERRNLPAVVYVHGGPWGRDGWWWDPSRQLLATRGYLCVQVNYRGSTGYGRDFVNAGDREWGRRMQTDLLDAIDHLAGRGTLDRDRVAIYGGSYGGYAALVGATFTPDVFRAAIAWVPPVNLVTVIKSFPSYWAAALSMWRRRVGDPDIEPAFLLSRSPISRVADLRIPLLLVQGENDPRCPVTEAEQLVAAMRERGTPHTYIVVPDEGHGFLRPENNVKLLGWIEDFLAEHLPASGEITQPQLQVEE
jgi:dipeptidyl aminopeptidase/acylaminoacyl peptidase